MSSFSYPLANYLAQFWKCQFMHKEVKITANERRMKTGKDEVIIYRKYKEINGCLKNLIQSTNTSVWT